MPLSSGLSSGLGGGLSGEIVAPWDKSTSTSISNPVDITGLLKRFETQYNAAQKKRKKRYESGLSKLAKAAGLFGPDYMNEMEKTTLAGATSAFAGGRGLGGSARPTAISSTMKTGFEDVRRTGLADVLAQTAEYRRTSPQIYPTAGTLSYLATGGFGLGLDKQQLAMQQAAAQQPGQPLGPAIGSPEWGEWVRSAV